MLNVIINILKLLLLITKRDLTFNKISLLNDKYPRWGSWDFFRSFKVCSNAKERVGAESNGKLQQQFIPSKTATLVPEFAVDDLPSAKLQPWFLRLQRRACAWTEHSDDDYG